MEDKPNSTPTLAIKRSASTAGLNEQPYRPAKRRAPKACQCCRTRKVRCNVTESGPPCMNCRLDEVECIVTESKRKRRTMPKSEEDEHNESPKVKPLRSGRQQVSNLGPDGALNFASLPQIQRVRKLGETEHVPHPLYRCHDERTVITSVAVKHPTLAPQNLHATFQDRNIRASSTITTTKAPSSTPSVSWYSNTPPIPSFLTPIPPHIGLDEMTYLHKKNALSIPEPSLRDAILRAYAEFVHPLMPISDLKGLLRMVHQNNGNSGKLSLLLFQAIMFAGSTFVDEEHFVKAGYNSRVDARNYFFQKTKLLYNFDYEQDQVIQIQTLLLMSWSPNPTNGHKDAWYWIGVATEIAHTIGLHRASYIQGMDSQQQQQQQQQEQGQLRRLWWSLVIRDRLMAIECRRSPRIRLHDSDVPMLKMDDFQLAISSPEAIRSEVNYPSTGDITTQRSLATICIEQAKLCTCLHNGMMMQQSSLEPGQPLPSHFNVKNDELEGWREKLPFVAQLEDDTTQSTSHCNASVIVHRSFLHMIYFIIAVDSHDASNCSSGMTTLISKLLNRQLVRHLPPTSMNILTFATMNHLQHMKTSDQGIAKDHLKAFAHCIQALRKLQEVYPNAHDPTTLIEASILQAAITFPSSGKPTTTIADLTDEAINLGLVTATHFSHPVTPPPDPCCSEVAPPEEPTFESSHLHSLAMKATSTNFDNFATLTPPSSHGSLDAGHGPWPLLDMCLDEADFESFINIEDFPTTMDEVGREHGMEMECLRVVEGVEGTCVAKEEEFSEGSVRGVEECDGGLAEVEVAV